MDKTSFTLKRLTELSEDDWNVALEKCRRLIDYRVQGRTKFGCHSEQHLGMAPFDYYVTEALDKLYSGTWKNIPFQNSYAGLLEALFRRM